MNFDATPEPGKAERAALRRAVELLADGDAVPAPYRSRWFAAALQENAGLREDVRARAYAGRPRSTRGATRA